MIGFYHIKDGMSVCYNQLAKLGKNENVNTEVLVKIYKALECGVDDVMEFVPDDQN
jgi:DNA-binding Xre family transcriptional regulator